MRIGIMQPYFFPYLGYFQLIASVDLMLLVGDFPFRRGFVNRNRILVDGIPRWLTLPIGGSSQNRAIEHHAVCLDTVKHEQLLRKVDQAYARAPCRRELMALVGQVVPDHNVNLAETLSDAVLACCAALRIGTPIQAISASRIVPHGAGVKRILALCKHFGASEYLNLPGGRSLYASRPFFDHGIRLGFVEPNLQSYPQAAPAGFLPRLSILDFLMNVEISDRGEYVVPFGIDWPSP